MIVTTNILMLPLIIVLWAVDSYLFVLFARMLLCCRRFQESAVGQPVVQLTEPSIRAMERLMTNKLHLHPPVWGVWLVLVGLLVVIRTVLILILV